MQTLQHVVTELEKNRSIRGISPHALAQEAGLPTAQVDALLSAQIDPTLSTLQYLADRLGLELVLVPKLVAQGLYGTPSRMPRPLTAVEEVIWRMGGTLPADVSRHPFGDLPGADIDLPSKPHLVSTERPASPTSPTGVDFHPEVIHLAR